jgi:hypothetical protein
MLKELQYWEWFPLIDSLVRQVPEEQAALDSPTCAGLDERRELNWVLMNPRDAWGFVF